MRILEQLSAKLLSDLQCGIPHYFHDEKREIQVKMISYDEILRHYCLSTVPRKVFLDRYRLVPPIESIPNEEKLAWRKFVNDVFPGTSPNFRLEAIKVIYTIAVLSS